MVSNHAKYALGLLLLAVFPPACMVLPFGIPPIQVQGGGEGRLIRPLPDPSVSAGAGMLRVGLHPLQLYRKAKVRFWDAGAGYSLDYSKAYYIHGAYLDGGIFFARTDYSRLGIHAVPKLLFDNQRGTGGGIAVQFTGEYFTFADGDFADAGPKGAIFGSAYGEASIGFYAEASGSVVGNISCTAFGLGIQARIPAAGGIMWFMLK